MFFDVLARYVSRSSMDIPSLSLVDLGDSVIPQLLWPGHNPRVVQVQQHGAFGEDTTAAISNLRRLQQKVETC